MLLLADRWRGGVNPDKQWKVAKERKKKEDVELRMFIPRRERKKPGRRKNRRPASCLGGVGKKQARTNQHENKKKTFLPAEEKPEMHGHYSIGYWRGGSVCSKGLHKRTTKAAACTGKKAAA